MCGITGIINLKKPVNPSPIFKMTNTLVHRGPDDEAYYNSPNKRVVFGHRRLSIVGLDGKHTIITIPKKNNPHYNIALVFNGEVYNFKELKKELKKKGYRSVSPSDFEVIIFGWQEWGTSCVDHFHGEFAFVVYDEETNEIFLARDRTGVKPLYYAFTKHKEFVFGSEPKAILAHPGITPKINKEALADFVLSTYTFAAGIPDLSTSLFQGIKQVPAGYRGLINKNNIFKLEQYWDIPFGNNKIISFSLIRKLLIKSIQLRIPQEVPTAVALSGGLDSSIVAAVAKRYSKIKKLLASCVRYSGDKNEDYHHAKILSQKMNFPLTGPVLTPKKMVDYIDRCILAMDSPFESIRRMGMMANYETVHRAGYKTALIGEGADEFNLGYYHKFPGLKIDRDKCDTPEKLQKLIQARVPYVESFFTPEFKKNIRFRKIIKHTIHEYYEKCPSSDPLQRMQYFYAKKFLQYLEDQNDRASMANSVEARLPYVDHKVIAASLAMPPEENISDHEEKIVLRRAFKKILPKEISLRKKSPFPANEDLEVHKQIQKLFEKIIESTPQSVWKLLNKKALLQLNNQYKARIKKLESKFGKGKGGAHLNAWLPISGNIDIRTSQVLCWLTIIRWMGLYKL